MSIIETVGLVSAMAESATPILDKLNVLALLKKNPDGDVRVAAAPVDPAAAAPAQPPGPVARGGGPPAAGAIGGGAGGAGGGGAAGGGSGAPPPPAGGAGRQAPDFSDLRLPSDIAQSMTPVLADFAMRLDEDSKSSALLAECRMHFAVNGKWSSYLLHIDRTYLEDARYTTDVATLAFLFKSGDRIQVISRDCEGPASSIESGWLDMRKKLRLDIGYVEWRHVRGLAGAQGEQAARQLQIALRLPDEIERKGTKRPPADLLSDKNDLDWLISTIKWYAGINYTTMVAFVQDMLTRAGLPGVLDKQAGQTWDSFEVEIPKLLVYLHKLGAQDGRPGYWYLASFLVVFMEDTTVEAARRVRCFELMARYQFISTAELEQLKKKLFG